jgi:hypothetical protein
MRYYQVKPSILRILAEGDLRRIDLMIYNLSKFLDLQEHLVRNLFGDAVKVATIETIEYLIEKLGRPTEGVMLPHSATDNDRHDHQIPWQKMIWLWQQDLLHSCNVHEVRDVAVMTILQLVLFLEVPYQNDGFNQRHLAVEGIVKRGDLEMAFWMCRDYPEYVGNFLFEALTTPQIEFFYHFYHHFSDENEINTPVDVLLECAFEGGSVDLITFLMEKGAVVTHVCLEKAVENGMMEALVFGCGIPSIIPNFTELCYTACRVGHLDVAKYLYSKGASISPLEAQRRMITGPSGLFMGADSDVAEWLFSLESDSKKFIEQVIELEKDQEDSDEEVWLVLAPALVNQERKSKQPTRRVHEEMDRDDPYRLRP